MPRVFVGMGSSMNREANVRAAVDELRNMFGKLAVSSVYETRPVGFEGGNFLNLAVSFESALEPEALVERLRGLERKFGRQDGAGRFAPRPLDLDLLLYGNLRRRNGTVRVPREDIIEQAYVLWPLSEIAGDVRHPETGETIAEIRARHPADPAGLWRVDLDL